ncbi:hypothetical protein F8388_005548 [Cannabis sativa]|uniref:Uncharacterized protein n=1 Tax=Cannabis sativa TaxID=3483 RepID=A0A7J6GYU0_CANSA|nr:hypothetical protein F8388_005548 [Cannabis sativa]
MGRTTCQDGRITRVLQLGLVHTPLCASHDESPPPDGPRTYQEEHLSNILATFENFSFKVFTTRVYCRIGYNMARKHYFPYCQRPNMQVMNILNSFDVLEIIFKSSDVDFARCCFHQYAINISEHGYGSA